MESRLLLIDGSSYLYRAHYALSQLRNSSGHPTGAIKGVASMVVGDVQRFQPDYVAFVIDAPGNCFRHDLYPAYKANRSEMPMDLQIQLDVVKAFVEAHGIPLVEVHGVEADDVMGTLAIEAARDGVEVIISTGDKDFRQLLWRGDISLYNSMKQSTIAESDVERINGVRSNQFIDYLALVGDTADNVPGIPGVGPKTAAQWLNRWGSLEGLITHQNEIPGNGGSNFREMLPMVLLAKELVTIKTDVTLGGAYDELVATQPNYRELLSIAEEFELRSLIEVYRSLI